MNLKLGLFNLKKNLRIDQLNESKICQVYLEQFDNVSEKEFYNYIKKDFNPYTYDKEVVSFLEAAQAEIESKPMVYDLKDLYKKVERKNFGELYRQPLITILEIINMDSDESRLEATLNTLSVYDWVPEIKQYIVGLSNNPVDVQNMTHNGKVSNVYTIVEKVQDGSLVFVGDRWFLVTESEIKQVLADDYIKDENKIREIRILEQIMSIASVDSERITYDVDEYLQIGISTKDGALYMNNEKLDPETTLQAIFNTPAIPAMKKDYYILCETNRANLDKFMEFDLAMKVVHPLKPYLEAYCFNYKDKNYLYTRDARTGSAFFQFENVTELIHDIQKEFDCDISHFYENKLSKELKALRSLEEKEKAIEIKLKDVNESIDLITEDQELLNEDKGLQLTLNNLLVHKNNLLKDLSATRGEKVKARKQLV